MHIGHTNFEEFLGMLLPTKDNCATQHIRKKCRLDWDEDFNNLDEIEALQPGQVVFDVGAYIGDTTWTFLQLGCEVHAFEPRPDNFFCLLYNCQDALCYNAALGDGQRYATDVRGGNMGAYALQPGQRYSVRLDSMGVDKLDFLKIDVEGFELSVLNGGSATIARLMPTIHIECNTGALAKFGHTSNDVMKTLRAFGYTNFRCVYHYTHDQTDWIVKR